MQLAELTRFVDDVEATTAFYRTLTGTEPVSEWPGGAEFDLGGATLIVHETYDPGPDDLPPADHVAFAVDDVDASFDRLADEGLAVEREPADYAWGRSAYLRDPAGNQVELTEA
jgi:lactoylglutathione lyase